MKYPFLRGITATIDSSDREENEDDSPKPEYRYAKRRILHGAFHKIEILKWHECEPSDAFIDFQDALSAYSFLRKFIHEPLNMKILRSALAEMTFAVTSIHRLNNDEITRRLAWQVARGHVRLVPREDEIHYIALAGKLPEAVPEVAEKEEVEAPPVRQEPVAVSAQSAAPAVVPEPVIEPVPVEVVPLVPAGAAAAQAATMVLAAESGAPFCDP